MYEFGRTLHEFMIKEPHPLAVVHDAVLEFLEPRDDAVIFGAYAVNAYVSEPRMTQDVDIMTVHASELAEEIRAYLAKKFYIAVRTRKIADGIGFRVYQVQSDGNRHLVDVRKVEKLPPSKRVKGWLTLAPEELIASKVSAYARRNRKPKGGTDLRDLSILLLTFPEFKTKSGPVSDALKRMEDKDISEVLRVWDRIVANEIDSTDDEEYGY